jgi:APA family basic amino acid/polyamine antiporter
LLPVRIDGIRLRCAPARRRLAAMNPSPALPPARLARVLGPLMATALVVGTVIGSGVFKKPQAVAEDLIAGGVSSFGLAALAWILGGLLALLGALSLAEVAVLFPRAGGNYVFLRESYGRAAGFLFGWVEFWIIRSASIAALASIFAESFYAVLSQLLGESLQNGLQALVGPLLSADALAFWLRQGLTVAVILGLGLVNVLGVRLGGGLQLLITSIKVGSLIGIAVLPFVVAWRTSADISSPIQVDNLRPVWPSFGQLSWTGLSKFGAALVGVLWAYHGWMNVAPVAEEVRAPQRNIPLALLGGVGIIIALYLSANLAYALVIPQDQMAKMKEQSPQDTEGQTATKPHEATDATVAIGFSRRLLGPWGVAVAAAAVMISVFGALNGNLLVGPRVLYAMGADGLAPRALGAIHARFRTPTAAIVALSMWSVALVLTGAAIKQFPLPVWSIGELTFNLNPPSDKPLFDMLTDFAIFGAVLFETLAVSSIFVFRFRLPHVERPYRCWGYPVVPGLYVLILSMVAFQMFLNKRTEAITGVAFIAIGAGVYWVFLRRRAGQARA